MEGSSKEWKKFTQHEVAAENFAQAVTACGVRRVIYLAVLLMEKKKNYQSICEAEKR